MTIPHGGLPFFDAREWLSQVGYRFQRSCCETLASAEVQHLPECRFAMPTKGPQMPSAPESLNALWADDGEALNYLASTGIRPNRGGVFSLRESMVLAPKERSAIDYLCAEWDYDTQRLEGL